MSYGTPCHQYQSSATLSPVSSMNFSAGGTVTSLRPRFHIHIDTSRSFAKSRAAAFLYQPWACTQSRWIAVASNQPPRNSAVTDGYGTR